MLAMEEDDLINQFLTNPMGSISEVSGVGQGQGGPFLASSFQPLWSQSYMHRASPAKTHVGQNQADEFALHGEGVQDKGIALGKRSLPEDIRDNNIYSSGMNLQMPLPVTPGTALQQNHNGNPQMPQLVQGSSLNHQSNGVISHPQSTTVAANGTARPRVRARRGQATDPHSIAERLRRERISERMKSLQELVPNSNKTDKASMLDEIIDHVRFLQMQVKVLSASRLGGAGAIPPQIADLSSRGSGSQASMSVSQDGASFEQTVATLLESDMTAAMQLLQNKGLCLMPIAMATAISGATRKPVTSSITTESVHGTSNSEKKFTGLSEGTCLAVTGIGSQSSSSPEGSGEKPFAYDNN